MSQGAPNFIGANRCDDIVVGHYFCGCDDASQEADLQLKHLSPEVQALLKAAIEWKRVFDHTEGQQYRLELAAENFVASMRKVKK